LIIHAVDDPLADYDNAQTMAERIPDAKLVTMESGGHPLLGHEERIQAEISEFLNEHK
jgi:pimeloyl-ACP methyl ester carboxylesterase